MDFSASQEKGIQTLSAIGIGVLAWEQTATAKYAQFNPQGYSLLSKPRFRDALCGIIGNKATQKVLNIDPSQMGNADFNPNFMGFLNTTVAAGAALIIADGLLNDNVKLYRDLPAVSSIVKGAGAGMIVGGAVGGIFDPLPYGPTGVSSGSGLMGSIATGNVPFMRGDSGFRNSVLA
jgi:hypothetical protein